MLIACDCFWFVGLLVFMKYAIIKCQNVTSKQVSYQNKTLKYLSNIKASLTCHCLKIYVTWFWKTDQVVTLILVFREIPILNIEATVVPLC